MKSVLISLVLVLGSLAYASDVKVSGQRQFPVLHAEFSNLHVTQAASALLTVDYDKNEVLLHVERQFHCPDGLMCAQVMPEPVEVQLPIVSIEYTFCGIRRVIAEHDMRPVDGAFERIILEDATDMFCKMIIPHEAKATYTTMHYDRVQGKAVTAESTMILQSFRHLNRLPR